MNIVDFITARLDDDAAEAHKAEAAREDELWVVTGSDNAVGIDYFPDRVLREVQSKRAILAVHTATDGGSACEGCGTVGVCDDWVTEDVNDCQMLRALANVYVDHPDFVAEWRI